MGSTYLELQEGVESQKCDETEVSWHDRRLRVRGLRVLLKPVPYLEEVLRKHFLGYWCPIDTDTFTDSDQMRGSVQT